MNVLFWNVHLVSSSDTRAVQEWETSHHAKQEKNGGFFTFSVKVKW